MRTYTTCRVRIDINMLMRIKHLAEYRDMTLTATLFGQPVGTISSLLSHLKNQLGLKLFMRGEDKKELTGITEAGQVFIEYAAAILTAKDIFDEKISHILASNDNKACYKRRVIETNCRNCGAPVNPIHEACEYCGSYYYANEF